MVHACLPAPWLRHVVRYYYQMEDLLLNRVTLQPVPARSPQILEFMFGTTYQLRRLPANHLVDVEPVALVGAKTHRGVELFLQGRLDAFTIAFQPGGIGTLFSLPVCELTDRDFNAADLLGRRINELHERLAGVSSLTERAHVANHFLASLPHAQQPPSGIALAATELRRAEGLHRVADLADRAGLSLRQFERRFQHEVGVAPKLYSRILRFEAALRRKSQAPLRPWTDIAHALGYHDQTHMIHDFNLLSGETPTALCTKMDMFVKPEAACDERSL